jgi:hypothetical protein
VRQACARATLAVLLAALPAAGWAEVTKTLQLDHDAAHAFAVENLAGSMRVMPASGARAEVTVTLHAESQALADAVTFEEVRGESGVPTLRVRYPRSETRFRYPERGRNGRSEMKYDGRRVEVSGQRGVLVYADLEVRLPRGCEARLRNGVGPVEGRGVEGTLVFDTGSGDIALTNVAGDVAADTGSGDVHVREAKGRLRCDTGSGDCDVSGFEGEQLDLDSGSGTLRVTGAETKRVKADSGSGEIHLSRVVAEEVVADTGSGDVELHASGASLRRVKADTGSGDVRLRLGADASFVVHADLGSGDLVSGFQDAQAIVRDREVVGYRRGDGRTRIDVDTGSGRVVVEP